MNILSLMAKKFVVRCTEIGGQVILLVCWFYASSSARLQVTDSEASYLLLILVIVV